MMPGWGVRGWDFHPGVDGIPSPGMFEGAEFIIQQHIPFANAAPDVLPG